MASDSPTVLNMLICDAAHRDTGSGKWTLLGLFSAITTNGFPTRHPQMIAYLALRGVSGKLPLRLQIVASDRKDEVLYKIEAELTGQDPNAVADFAIPFRNVTFVKPGEHLLQAFAGDEFLAERPITVNKT